MRAFCVFLSPVGFRNALKVSKANRSFHLISLWDGEDKKLDQDLAFPGRIRV
jgi:hypothetical protein